MTCARCGAQLIRVALAGGDVIDCDAEPKVFIRADGQRSSGRLAHRQTCRFPFRGERASA